MTRYFLAFSYKGTFYNGLASQTQSNVSTIQNEIEKTLHIIFRTTIATTTSSRTDAGVHAIENYLQFDTNLAVIPNFIYKINALLPLDIYVSAIYKMHELAHCRFDPIGRDYKYYLHTVKNPFVQETSWHYPYKINTDLLHQTAQIIKDTTNFESFSKKHGDNYTHICTIAKSEWHILPNGIITYNVVGNRFLRGMVRGLVGTMLQVAKGAISIKNFEEIISSNDCTKADFSTAAKGLFLQKVIFPEGYFDDKLIS
jgi:tRNA pseudouridine38-40 synthase